MKKLTAIIICLISSLSMALFFACGKENSNDIDWIEITREEAIEISEGFCVYDEFEQGLEIMATAYTWEDNHNYKVRDNKTECVVAKSETGTRLYAKSKIEKDGDITIKTQYVKDNLLYESTTASVEDLTELGISGVPQILMHKVISYSNGSFSDIIFDAHTTITQVFHPDNFHSDSNECKYYKAISKNGIHLKVNVEQKDESGVNSTNDICYFYSKEGKLKELKSVYQYYYKPINTLWREVEESITIKNSNKTVEIPNEIDDLFIGYCS